MKSLLEQIESRLAVCAKATPKPWHVGHINEDLDHAEIESATLVPICESYRRENEAFLCASRNQREGELAALKCAVEALEKPYICSVCGDRSKEKCGRVCDGDESSCCKYFLNFDQALAQITKLMGEGK